MNPELPTDEVRRQLRDTDRAHQASMPLARRAFRRAFDPTSATSAAEQAELLGVPRRAVLSGGLVLGAGLVLAACGGGSDEQIPVTGSVPAAPDSSTTTQPGSAETNVVLLKTAQSIELLAIDEYGKALDSDLLETPAVIQTVELFRTQHEEHADLIGATLRDLGQSPVTEPNAYLYENAVVPAQETLTDETTVLELALALENTAAGTYVKATPVFTTPELRQAGMSIGGVEARHVALLHLVLEQSPVPTPFFRTAAAAPEQAYVE
jgi:hypothetical protein